MIDSINAATIAGYIGAALLAVVSLSIIIVLTMLGKKIDSIPTQKELESIHPTDNYTR